MIATANATSTASELLAQLPPSVRDFQIYRFVQCDCRSTRAAAREFQLSQTRIRQIIAGVRAFFIRSVPRPAGDDGPDTRLVVAEQLSREQLECLYRRAVRAFEETETEDEHGNVLPGKATFLLAAARITLWMAKVPVHDLPAFREDEDEVDAPGRRERSTRIDQSAPEFASPEFAQLREEMAALDRAEARAAAIRAAYSANELHQDPPNKECSQAEVSSGREPASDSDAGDVSDDTEVTCDSSQIPRAAIGSETLLPAQQALLQTAQPPLWREAPEAGPPRNRHERRARERLRRRLLAKR